MYDVLFVGTILSFSSAEFDHQKTSPSTKFQCNRARKRSLVLIHVSIQSKLFSSWARLQNI